MLWFPSAFARVLPGRIFNVALLVHGEEALLATGFIFLVHFFNGHLRPDKFPIDIVIFTGAVTTDELQEQAGRVPSADHGGHARGRVGTASNGGDDPLWTDRRRTRVDRRVVLLLLMLRAVLL